jgi:hypothetical protein
MNPRHNQRTAVADAISRAYSIPASALWTIGQTARPFSFTDADAKHARDLVDVDSDPNSVEPDAQTRVYSERCASLGILVECDQAVEIEVWTKTGLPAGDPQWVCIRRGITIAPATRALQIVDVNWSQSFVRVVSGAVAGHPASLFVAVC